MKYTYLLRGHGKIFKKVPENASILQWCTVKIPAWCCNHGLDCFFVRADLKDDGMRAVSGRAHHGIAHHFRSLAAAKNIIGSFGAELGTHNKKVIDNLHR
jgi:hypothetical protein